MERNLSASPTVVSRQRTIRLMVVVSLIWFASSWLQPPIGPEPVNGAFRIRAGPVTVAPPMVLTGDSPHYLIMVNSLIEDGDFDVSNNYEQAQAGDWDTGARFRSSSLDRHTDQSSDGKQYLTHPPMMPLILAAFVFPLRGTAWVEPACIWVVMALTLLAVWVFAFKTGDHGFWAGLLALATPLWFYARDIWTEPWAMAAWVGLLFVRSFWGLAALALLGTMIRYPFLVVVVAMAGVSAWEGDRRRAWALSGGGAVGLLLSVGMAQWIFRDVGHFSLLHMGVEHSASGGMSQVIAPFGLPFRGMVGLLFDPEDGLLPFFPYLVWGFPRLVSGFRRYLPVLALYLFYSSYQVWHAGAGFSTRFLVPALPALILAVRESRPRSRLFWLAVLWGLGWGFFSGLLAFWTADRTMWEAVIDFSRYLSHVVTDHLT